MVFRVSNDSKKDAKSSYPKKFFSHFQKWEFQFLKCQNFYFDCLDSMWNIHMDSLYHTYDIDNLFTDIIWHYMSVLLHIPIIIWMSRYNLFTWMYQVSWEYSVYINGVTYSAWCLYYMVAFRSFDFLKAFVYSDNKSHIFSSSFKHCFITFLNVLPTI